MKKLIDRKYIYLVLISLVFLIALLPIIYCSFFNYATGDDFTQSDLTHLVIVNHGTFGEFINGTMRRLKAFYNGWGGNWSACLLWTIQPSIWGESFYHITFYLAALFIYGGIGLLSYYWYKKYINAPKSFFVMVLLLLFFVLTQGMPNGNTAFFWYAVVANYIFPFGMMLVSVIWIDKYINFGGKRYLIYVSLAMIFIGGAGYMTLVVTLEIAVLYGIYLLFAKNKNKRIFLLIIPCICFLISVFINFKAPGNYVRGGETIDFSISNIIYTIFMSICRGSVNAIKYFGYCRLLIIYVPLISLFTWEFVQTEFFNIKYPVIKIGIGFLMYCSSYAPMVMMKDIVASSGHTNTYWMLFVLWLTYSLVIIICIIKKKFGVKLNKYFNIYKIGCLALILAMLLMYKHFIGNMFSYICYDFIKSGRLNDFENQMQERFALLNNPNVDDVVVPYMNWDQGPFIHFAITDDPTVYSNIVTADFYGKNTITGMPREEYYELYKKDK